ncbi:glutathione S-transferase family protein [Sphingorhabdus soli]|uniref:Glutathione S-transferase family protein n=1 Tax=Flavisphingopyxis soli TaxID=2601267 RepID=A0A5C6U977_9SPHN|nr:glutathione S-transferase family protein [Sphingorhabdus soli]TXC68165.1 glutathione S-transferase family protein [Sphingorhabdus soli]
MIIYGSSFSPFVRKLLAYCEERGIAFELKSVGIGDPDPGYAAASPLKKMPAINDDGYCLADSSAIIHYLEARDGAALIPTEPQARGRTIWFEEFADTVMGACVGAMFFNRIVAPKFLGRAGDSEAADAAEAEQWPKICDYLQGELADGREFLVGEALTLADLAVVSSLHNMDHAGAKWCDGHDAVKAYFERIKARPSFAKWTAKEYAILAG